MIMAQGRISFKTAPPLFCGPEPGPMVKVLSFKYRHEVRNGGGVFPCKPTLQQL